MISIVCCVLVYYLGSLLVNYVFSVNLCGFVSLVSSNFECGFVSALSTYIRFRFSYWLVICNFIIFELELLISFVFIYSIASYCIYLVVIGLLLLLLFDLYLDQISLCLLSYAVSSATHSFWCFVAVIVDCKPLSIDCVEVLLILYVNVVIFIITVLTSFNSMPFVSTQYFIICFTYISCY